MFRAGLLLIIRRIKSVYTATGIVMRYVDWLLLVNIMHESCETYWFMLFGEYQIVLINLSSKLQRYKTSISLCSCRHL